MRVILPNQLGAKTMQVKLCGRVSKLTELEPGTLFLSRSNRETMFGCAVTWGRDRGAILFSRSLLPKEVCPCVVEETSLKIADVVALPEAMLVPALSENHLQFTSNTADGPGMLTLFSDRTVLR